MTVALLSKKAQQDLEQIRQYIANDDAEAAERVRNAILDIADLLAENVEAGRPIANATQRHADVRWFVVPRFRNYLIFYRPFRQGILVVRVLHAAQDWTRYFGEPAS